MLAGSMLVRDHRERLEGFSAVMAEEFPRLAILPVLEGRDDPEAAHMLVSDALSKKDGIIGIYSLGAGNRGLIRALKEKAAERTLTVIAHELTARRARYGLATMCIGVGQGIATIIERV